MAAGALRVNGTDLEWRDASDTVRSVTGANQGSTTVPVGSIRVSGTDLEYVDANGDHRIITPDGQVNDSKTPGGIGVFAEDLRYIDGNGDRQFIVPIALSSGDFVPIDNIANSTGAWNGDYPDIDEGDPHDGDTSYMDFFFLDTSETQTFHVGIEDLTGEFREFQTQELVTVIRLDIGGGSPSYDFTTRLYEHSPGSGLETLIDSFTVTGRTDTSYKRWSPPVEFDPDNWDLTNLFIEVEATANAVSGDFGEVRVTAAHLQVS